jgi:hypothetical protein
MHKAPPSSFPRLTAQSLSSLLLLVAIGCAFLPWWNSVAAGLSANAYDLAEWIGLAPAVRYVDPPLVAPQLLRLAFIGLSILCLLHGLRLRYANHASKWGLGFYLLALLLPLWNLPPIEFWREIRSSSDPNHWQLFWLLVWGYGLIIAGVAIQRRWPFGSRLLWRLSGSVVLLTIISAVVGTALAFKVIRDLGVDTPIGLGFVGYIVALLSHVLTISGKKIEDGRLSHD